MICFSCKQEYSETVDMFHVQHVKEEEIFNEHLCGPHMREYVNGWIIEDAFWFHSLVVLAITP